MTALRLRQLRKISRAIGFKVAQTARAEGAGRSYDSATLQAEIDRFMWYPDDENIR